MDIERIWEENIRLLIWFKCNNHQAKFAERIGKAANVVSRILTDNPDYKRPATKEFVKHIEGIFDLPSGWMSTYHTKDSLENGTALAHSQDTPISKDAIKIARRWERLPPELQEIVDQFIAHQEGAAKMFPSGSQKS